MIGVFYATSVTWRMVSVSSKKNHAYRNRWCLTSVENYNSLPHFIIWKGKRCFWGEMQACLQALLIPYLVASMQNNSGKKHWEILEPQAFLNTDKGWAEILPKDLNIYRNLTCRKQSCSLRKQESGRKRHLAQPVAKGSYSDSCEIMGSGEMSRWCIKGEHGCMAPGET